MAVLVREALVPMVLDNVLAKEDLRELPSIIVEHFIPEHTLERYSNPLRVTSNAQFAGRIPPAALRKADFL